MYKLHADDVDKVDELVYLLFVITGNINRIGLSALIRYSGVEGIKYFLDRYRRDEPDGFDKMFESVMSILMDTASSTDSNERYIIS